MKINNQKTGGFTTMTTEKMTVHKALAELKLLDDRITKAIQTNVYCLANKHSNNKVFGVELDEYIKTMQGGYDKVISLIARRKAIKKAVVLSNATTKVTIAGIEYTVAEAIEMKNHGIELDKLLMLNIQKQYNSATKVINIENDKDLLERADQYVVAIYGQKEGKTNAADIEKVRNDFLTANQYELIDPLSVLDIMAELEESTNSFMAEVDSALSVSNALTEIQISY